MKTPLQKVAQFTQRHAMLEGASGLLIAVSGGPDSVALLDMLARISAGEGGAFDRQSADPSGDVDGQPTSLIPLIHIAHLDHMLRGRESAEDAEFVRSLAEEFGFQVTCTSIDVGAAAKRSRLGIEEAARVIRYDFLRTSADETGCDRIAVGHTMTDQAETFLMRLIRGAGLRGLSAMRPVIEVPTPHLPVSASPLLIRPLLCITRDEVEAYCNERRLRFRTDGTNLSLHYTRNRIRADVLPALMAINPRIVESISRTAEHIAGDQDVLEDLAWSLLRTARLGSEVCRDIEDDTIGAYSVPVLLEQKVGLRRRMIIEAIRVARALARGDQWEDAGEVTSVHVEAVESLLTRKPSGKHIVLPGLEVWREYDALVIKRSTVKESYLFEISSECPSVEAGGFAFTLQRGLPAEMLGSVIEGVRRAKKATGRDWMMVALDDFVLPEHLAIRPRLPGERAHVLGRPRTIKLKKLMIDHRIPSSRRATWPLVTTPDGSYIWSPGLPPSVEFAAHDKTQSLAIVRASAT